MGQRPEGVGQHGPGMVVGSRGQDIVGQASKQGMGGTLNQGFGKMGPYPSGRVKEETLKTDTVGDGAPRHREIL